MDNIVKLEKYKVSYELCQKFLKDLKSPKEKDNLKSNMKCKLTTTDKNDIQEIIDNVFVKKGKEVSSTLYF